MTIPDLILLGTIGLIILIALGTIADRGYLDRWLP